MTQEPKNTGRSRAASSNPEKRASRPRRVPVSGFRDVLTVYGKQDGFEYRWVADKNDKGTRIRRFERAGYTLVDSEEVDVGEDSVYKTSSGGSITAVSAGSDGNMLFLMKIDKDFYLEDQASKMDAIDSKEAAIHAPPEANNPDGQYGPGGRRERINTY